MPHDILLGTAIDKHLQRDFHVTLDVSKSSVSCEAMLFNCSGHELAMLSLFSSFVTIVIAFKYAV